MIIGFGQHHTDITRRFCGALAEELLAASSQDEAQQIANRHATAAGTFKDKGWKVASVRRVVFHQPYPSVDPSALVCVVEGTYSHYRDDHPLSPDGIAMLEMTWCVTVCNDEIWNQRTFISV